MAKQAARQYIKIAGRSFRLPGSRLLRLLLGVLLIVSGLLGFLPVLGFWMLPLGFMVLSVDYAPVRRLRRKLEISYLRWRRKRSG